MGNSYVDGKVRDALVAAKGSRATAQKLLMTWAVEDPQLMLGIAQPFLKAIAAAAVERGVRQLSGGGGRAQSATGGPRSGGTGALSKEALAGVLDRLGRDSDEMPGARPAPSAGKPAGPGKMRAATAVVHQAGGDIDHQKAMLTIAKAFVAKKIR